MRVRQHNYGDIDFDDQDCIFYDKHCDEIEFWETLPQLSLWV